MRVRLLTITASDPGGNPLDTDPLDRVTTLAFDIFGTDRYRLVALSSGEHRLLELLAKERIGADFDEIISVQKVGVFKPHPAVYRTAARQLETEPYEIMMVAAHTFDILGARACGYRRRLRQPVRPASRGVTVPARHRGERLHGAGRPVAREACIAQQPAPALRPPLYVTSSMPRASKTNRIGLMMVVVSDPANSSPTPRLSESSTSEPESPP